MIASLKFALTVCVFRKPMHQASPTYIIDDALWSRSLTKEIASQLVEQSLECFYGDMQGQTHTALLHVSAFTDRSKEGHSMQQFKLQLNGPADPLLPTQTYRLRHASLGDFAVFLSAVARLTEGIEYEACFSHES